LNVNDSDAVRCSSGFDCEFSLIGLRGMNLRTVQMQWMFDDVAPVSDGEFGGNRAIWRIESGELLIGTAFRLT